jgi:hypothetical protein
MFAFSFTFLSLQQDIKAIKEVTDCDLLASGVATIAFAHPSSPLRFANALRDRFPQAKRWLVQNLAVVASGPSSRTMSHQVIRLTRSDTTSVDSEPHSWAEE